jgi:HEAT repeat protein
MDYEETAPFLRASTYVQMEPVWGGSEDSAGPLRACAVLALVQCTDLTRGEILRHLVDALADESDTVRVEAARAIEQMNGEEAALLLRVKAHAGDTRSAVIGQVFDSILALERDRAVDFVAQFLESANEEVRDEAALSLGASRLSGAVRILIDAWQGSQDSLFLRALSSSRDETALTFLLGLVREGITRDAAAALEALKIHADSPEIQTRVDQARMEREQRSR